MDETFMYGDLSQIDAPPAQVMTVLLIGWDGRRSVLTGSRDELWREFVFGDGGKHDTNPAATGWEYWCPQPLLTKLADAGCSSLNHKRIVK